MKAAAIIVAAGRGTRLGSDLPKQFLTLGPWPVWRWSTEAFLRHPDIGEIVLVLPDKMPDMVMPEGVIKVVGGATRAESVLNGINALSGPTEIPVLIHDAARPGLSSGIIDALITALEHADGAAPALPVNDALKRGDRTLETVSRDGLNRVQTPQAFKLGKIKSALQAAVSDFVDDLEAIEYARGTVTLTTGHERLSKITRPGDLEWIEDMLMRGDIRTGSGFDVHAFEPGDHVTLCGVKIPHSAKLKGHSDADAGWHALTDAILGALALGDIGDHFPPSDPQWKAADSALFLKHASDLANERGYAVGNADITIICEAPKVKPHREAMRRATAECLGIALDRVSVKATTTESLGFTGRSEGLAAQASVTLASRSGALG